MEINLYVKQSDPTVEAEIQYYVLPGGETVRPEVGALDLRRLNSFKYFDIVIHINKGHIKYKKKKGIFNGLLKGKEGVKSLDIQDLIEVPISG